MSTTQEEISELLDTMLAGKPINRSPKYLASIKDVKRSDGGETEAEISEWAERLAEDLSQFAD